MKLPNSAFQLSSRHRTNQRQANIILRMTMAVMTGNHLQNRFQTVLRRHRNLRKGIMMQLLARNMIIINQLLNRRRENPTKLTVRNLIIKNHLYSQSRASRSPKQLSIRDVQIRTDTAQPKRPWQYVALPKSLGNRKAIRTHRLSPHEIVQNLKNQKNQKNQKPTSK